MHGGGHGSGAHQNALRHAAIIQRRSLEGRKSRLYSARIRQLIELRKATAPGVNFAHKGEFRALSMNPFCIAPPSGDLPKDCPYCGEEQT